MKINANGSAKNGIFGKALNALNPRASMSKGKANVVKKLSDNGADVKKAANNILNSKEYDKKALGNFISKEDFMDQNKRLGVAGEFNKLGDSIAERAGNIKKGKGFSGNKMDNLAIGLSGAKDYYMGDSSIGTKALRYGATAGAVGAGAVGVRYLSGGSLTRNNDGQKDIAGVPFI